MGPTPAPSTRIVLADDHTIVRNGLRHILENELHATVVAQAENGKEAVELALLHRPDVVILDVTMPVLNGIEATRRIVAEMPDAKVIALSMHSDRGIVSEVLRAGALGYLLKDCDPAELELAVKTVRTGRIYITAAITDLVVRDYVRKLEDATTRDASSLSPKEREVVQLFAEGKSTKEIASALGVSVSTVESHRRHIMEKLDIHSIAELTKYAIRSGLTPLE